MRTLEEIAEFDNHLLDIEDEERMNYFNEETSDMTGDELYRQLFPIHELKVFKEEAIAKNYKKKIEDALKIEVEE